MSHHLEEIFSDRALIEKIQRFLPYFFQLAELESSRAGKIGMEVGSLRERILIALLVHKFGEDNVETEIPITEPEVDAKVYGEPLSIKTITGMGGVKIAWTVDAEKAREFRETYYRKCAILLTLIRWTKDGSLYFFPLEVQKKVFDNMGREKYLKLPKPGTNPRGVEFNKIALVKLMGDPATKSINIFWHRSKISYKPYQRWVKLWSNEDIPSERELNLSDFI